MSHKKNTLRLKKELYYISLIVVVSAILLLSIFGPDGYLEMKEARQEQQSRKAKVDGLVQGNAQHREKIEELKSDPAALERYARKKGYGRKNEIIEQLPENPDPEP
jgi:cell division protein FtsB